MLRIGYLFEHPTVSGAEASALDLLAGTDRRAFEILAFAPPEGGLAARIRALGIATRPWAAPRGDRDERELIERLRPEKLDILHANTLELGRLLGRISLACGARGVAHVRSFGRLRERARQNLCANRALIAVSHAVRDDLAGQGVPVALIRVIHNGVLIPAAGAPGSLRSELGVPAGAALVVWIGQITVRKAPDLFVEAARRCAAAAGAVHFAIAGDVFGSKEENLALARAIGAAATAPPLRGRLHLLGWRNDAIAILREATCLAHTARQEPLGRVLIEALAAGTPIVATDVGGTREAVGPCGVLVPPDDPGAIAASIRALLGDPARRAAMARDGLARWRDLFQPDRMARDVEAVWRHAAT